MKKRGYPIEDIELKIVYKKPKDKSKGSEKLKIIKKLTDNLISLSKGCIRKFEIEEHF